MNLYRVSVLAAAVVVITAGQRLTIGQGGRGNASADMPVLPYTLVEWPAPPKSAAGAPALWNFIQVSSVAITPQGRVLVLHRGAHPIMEFESSGALVRSWGDGLFSEGKVGAMPQAFWTADKSHYSAVYGPAGCSSCGAHSVRVDPQGNIWVIDAPGHVLYKLNADGKEIMRLGTKGVSGTGPTSFNLPTDIAFAANGDLYVTDGYGGARVVKFTRDGKFLLQWGTRGQGPGRVRAAAQCRARSAGPRLRDRSRQPADPGVRRERQVPDPVDRHRRRVGSGDDEGSADLDRRRAARSRRQGDRTAA